MENDFINVRVCEHCKRPMKDGWLFCGYLTYCSKSCFSADNPDEDFDKLLEDIEGPDSYLFWTTWD